MKPYTRWLPALTIGLLMFWSCSDTAVDPVAEPVAAHQADQLEANIKMYTEVWDKIVNEGNLDLFNEENFTADLVMHEGALDVVGIDGARDYYTQFLNGFSDITFTIKDVFGQGDKIVKYWNFKGNHTGDFFGIPPTGKSVDLDGVTLVRMQNGKITEERDIMDNMEFMQQLGLLPME